MKMTEAQLKKAEESILEDFENAHSEYFGANPGHFPEIRYSVNGDGFACNAYIGIDDGNGNDPGAGIDEHFVDAEGEIAADYCSFRRLTPPQK